MENNIDSLSPLTAWWAFTQAQYQLENDGKTIPEDAVILSFMGSGASTNVTAKQMSKALSGLSKDFPVDKERLLHRAFHVLDHAGLPPVSQPRDHWQVCKNLAEEIRAVIKA